MTSGQDRTIHVGACHCGVLRVEFSLCLPPAKIVPRGCDCSFCRMHGAAYVSDPAGQLRIAIGASATPIFYRQGSESARFHLCSECGVLVAVSYAHQGQLHGAVNVACLDERADFGEPIKASPRLLSADEKIARWLQSWVPDVQMVSADA